MDDVDDLDKDGCAKLDKCSHLISGNVAGDDDCNDAAVRRACAGKLSALNS